MEQAEVLFWVGLRAVGFASVMAGIVWGIVLVCRWMLRDD